MTRDTARTLSRPHNQFKRTHDDGRASLLIILGPPSGACRLAAGNACVNAENQRGVREDMLVFLESDRGDTGGGTGVTGMRQGVVSRKNHQTGKG